MLLRYVLLSIFSVATFTFEACSPTANSSSRVKSDDGDGSSPDLISKRLATLSVNVGTAGSYVDRARRYMDSIKNECEYVAGDNETTDNSGRGSTVRSYAGSVGSELSSFASATSEIGGEARKLSGMLSSKFSGEKSSLLSYASSWESLYSSVGSLSTSVSALYDLGWKISTDAEGVNLATLGAECRDATILIIDAIKALSDKAYEDGKAFYSMSGDIK